MISSSSSFSEVSTHPSLPPKPTGRSKPKNSSKMRSRDKNKLAEKSSSFQEKSYNSSRSDEASGSNQDSKSSSTNRKNKSRSTTPQSFSSNGSKDTSNLTSRQKKRIKKKELRKEKKIFKQHSKRIKSEQNIAKNSTKEESDSNKEDIIVIDSDSEEEEPEIIKSQDSTVSPQSKRETSVSSAANELTNNTDFISFNFSSDEDSDDGDNSNTNSVYDRDDDSDDGRTYVPLITSKNTPNGSNTDESDSNDEYYNPTSETSRKRKARPLDIQHKRQDTSKEYPWIKNNMKLHKEIADRLTAEIKDFVAYLSPSEAEIIARNEAVSRVRKLVADIWSDATVNVFGSYATDMYLPGSDIDMVITSPTQRLATKSHLYQLGGLLRNNPKIASNVTIIGKARVPIIKFVDRSSNIHIDISFERTNGLTAVEHIRGWSQRFPCLRELVIPIKQFLSHRKLNDVSNGGMGGYSVICSIVSFLVLHPKLSTGSIDPSRNLGTLLIEFFELYGKNFNYDNVALSMDPSSFGYINKKRIYNLCHSGAKYTPYALVIQDPDDPDNNISRGTYKIMNIKRAFSGAFDLLTAKCYELNSLSQSNRKNQSILGMIIKLKGPERDFLDFRSKVENIAWRPTSSDSGDEYSENDNDYDPAEVDYDNKQRSPSIQPLPRIDRKSGNETPNTKLESFFIIDSDEEVKDNDNDEKYEPQMPQMKSNAKSSALVSNGSSSKEPIELSSDSEYDPADLNTPAISEEKENNNTSKDDSSDSRTHSIQKKLKRRDYWSQKSGTL